LFNLGGGASGHGLPALIAMAGNDRAQFTSQLIADGAAEAAAPCSPVHRCPALSCLPDCATSTTNRHRNSDNAASSFPHGRDAWLDDGHRLAHSSAMRANYKMQRPFVPDDLEPDIAFETNRSRAII
jgi:hypothetical protein